MIVVFDGDCVLCSGWVRFLLKHDRYRRFRFAAMQSERGRRLLEAAGLQTERLETLLLVDGERSYRHTDAIMKILDALGWPWRAVGVLRVVPSFVRDPLYRLVARNRYRLFGRRVECYVPAPEERARFLF